MGTPRISIFSPRRDFVTDLLDKVFLREGRSYYERTFDLKLENPIRAKVRISDEGAIPYFQNLLISDVRLIGPESNVVSVMAATYNCGSAGFKYLGFFRMKDRGARFLGPGMLSALQAPGPIPEQQTYLTPKNRPLLSTVAPGIQFSTYSIEDAVYYADLDKDGVDELVGAFMLWDTEDQCHWCEHRWLVQVLGQGTTSFVPWRSPCYGASITGARAYLPAKLNGYDEVPISGIIAPRNLILRNTESRAKEFLQSIMEELPCDDEYITLELLNYDTVIASTRPQSFLDLPPLTPFQ